MNYLKYTENELLEMATEVKDVQKLYHRFIEGLKSNKYKTDWHYYKIDIYERVLIRLQQRYERILNELVERTKVRTK